MFVLLTVGEIQFGLFACLRWNVGLVLFAYGSPCPEKLDLVILACSSPTVSKKTNRKQKYPPAQNQYMQEIILGQLIFARMHAGPVFALARIQENIIEEVFPEHFDKFLGEFTQCEYMPRLYSHPREYRKIFLANYLCIGFVPGGTSTVSTKDASKKMGEALDLQLEYFFA